MKKFYSVKVNGNVYEVEVEEISGAGMPSAPTFTAPAVNTPAPAPKAKAEGTAVNAPMQGTILSVNVSVGGSVKKGDLICLLEAMKMENEIFAPCDGKVAQVNITKGQTVATGETIAVIA